MLQLLKRWLRLRALPTSSEGAAADAATTAAATTIPTTATATATAIAPPSTIATTTTMTPAVAATTGTETDGDYSRGVCPSAVCCYCGWRVYPKTKVTMS